MKLFVHPDIVARHPEYRMFTVLASDADNSRDASELGELLANVSREIRGREELARPAEHPRVAAWREAFRDFGADPDLHKPSLAALLDRAVGGADIPPISPLVAILNLVSLRHLLPCGGDDLAHVRGDFGLALADGSETFEPIGGGQTQSPDPGEIIYRDEEKVLCRRWIWRQGEASKIRPESRDVAINVDVLPPASPEEGLAAAREIALLIETYCGARTEILEVGGETASVALPSAVAAGVLRHRLEDDSIRRLVDERGDRLSDSSDMAEWTIDDLSLRGVQSILVDEEFRQRLASGDRLSIYQGFDPTSPRLHVGHLVSLRVLRWFQLQGHRVIFLLGDGTALIGDPSGRSEQRTMLTREDVARNMETYRQQAGKALDFDGDNPVELLNNGSWLLEMKLEEILQLMSHVTAQRLLERDMFKNRLRQGEPLFYVETIYPLLQGYDSVAMEVDAELGGRDQLFNMLMGRDLAKSYLGRDKHVLTTPLLAGFDGRKMSKTYGNTVDLEAVPFQMFDGILRVNDDLILSYARLLTDLSWSDLARLESKLADDPVAVKEEVALRLVGSLHSREAAEGAQREFIRVRREGRLPDDMPTATISATPAEAPLVDYLGAAQPALGVSKSQLRRLIQQGGLRLDGEHIRDPFHAVGVGELEGRVLRLGKKRFFRLTVEA